MPCLSGKFDYFTTSIDVMFPSDCVRMQGLSVVVGSYNGEDVLLSFGGYNGRYNNEVWSNFKIVFASSALVSFRPNFASTCQVNVLKPSHKSTLPPRMETSVPDSVSAVHNATNATRDVESEYEAGQEGKIREIVMDAEPMVSTQKHAESQLLLIYIRKQVQVTALFGVKVNSTHAFKLLVSQY